MRGSRRKGSAVLLVCVLLSAWWSYAILAKARVHGQMKMMDFAAVYFGARGAMHGEDPYDAGALLREYKTRREGETPGGFGNDIVKSAVTLGTNLPTTLFLVVPFTLLPWTVAENLWMALSAGLLALAAGLIWDLGADASPGVWVGLAGWMLLNSELLLAVGNAAGIAVSSCVIAVWCLLRERYAWGGVVLLGISLVMKPHDAGFLWLYLLLRGGAPRKRALQALGVTAVVGVCTAIWLAGVSPHWVQELQRNLATTSVPGAVNDPGPFGVSMRSTGPIIDLRAMLSVIWEDPRFYAWASYGIVGSLILAWIFRASGSRGGREEQGLALAAISVLSLLLVYHRTYDAGLLLLTIPACAMLWAGKERVRWVALVLTWAAIFFTSSVPVAVMALIAKRMQVSASTLAGKLMTVLVLRPAPLILLATGCFYLWMFWRCKPGQTGLETKAVDSVS